MTLHREIVKKIFTNLGANPMIEFGKTGLTIDSLKIKESIKYSYDGIEKKIPLWCGSTSIGNNIIRVLLAKIEEEEIIEYALALCLEGNPIYTIKLVYDDEDDGLFLLQEDENLINPNLKVKLLALLGMEKIVDDGIIWKQCNSYKDLLYVIKKILQIN